MRRDASYALVGDVGGTNARFAVADLQGARPSIVLTGAVLCKDHESLAAAADAFLASAGLAGLAGALEVAGPFGRMVPQFPTNYGFTAIIVAFLGRLQPLGILLAGVVLAITFVGGEVAQTTMQLPNAAVGIFQAMMLFLLLAGDIFVRYRLRRVRPQAAGGVA